MLIVSLLNILAILVSDIPIQVGNEGIKTMVSVSPRAALPTWEWDPAAQVTHWASFSQCIWDILQWDQQNPYVKEKISCGPHAEHILKYYLSSRLKWLGQYRVPIFQPGKSVQRMCTPPHTSGSNTSCCTCNISLLCIFTVNLTYRAFTVYVPNDWAAHGQ